MRLLRAILGPELVASLAGDRTRRCVVGWAQGRDRPSEPGQMRLRIALELVLLVMEGEGIEAARDWLLRREQILDGRSPLALLAQERPVRARRTLVAAARASYGTPTGAEPGSLHWVTPTPGGVDTSELPTGRGTRCCRSRSKMR